MFTMLPEVPTTAEAGMPGSTGLAGRAITLELVADVSGRRRFA
jgi:hypothetical protein